MAAPLIDPAAIPPASAVQTLDERMAQALGHSRPAPAPAQAAPAAPAATAPKPRARPVAAPGAGGANATR